MPTKRPLRPAAKKPPAKPVNAKRVAPKPAPVKPGPKPEVYKIEGNWEDAVKKSFEKKKPAGGWPK